MSCQATRYQAKKLWIRHHALRIRASPSLKNPPRRFKGQFRQFIWREKTDVVGVVTGPQFAAKNTPTIGENNAGAARMLAGEQRVQQVANLNFQARLLQALARSRQARGI